MARFQFDCIVMFIFYAVSIPYTLSPSFYYCTCFVRLFVCLFESAVIEFPTPYNTYNTASNACKEGFTDLTVLT